MFGAIRVLNSAGYVRRRSGPGHHGKATNRIGSMVISLSGISLAGLLTFLLVMRLNVGYNNNIFLCHGGKVRSVFVKSPHFYHSKVHVDREDIELRNSSLNYRAGQLTRAVVPYVALKEVAHRMVCLSEG